MGKGSQTTTTNQAQTYTPAPQGYSAISGALTQAQNAAQLPFNIPQAPVAGFSPDQLSAFQTVNNAQGMAQPYINQAQQYFQQGTQPDVSQFFNPYASAVTGQLNNIFGQQMAQTTGQLTQAAGGVGADRIAVGQANLANQQGLAAGQTLAGLYAPSLQAAQQQESLLQGAGYGTAALGSQAQNAALTGAQAQLGIGGLQQQLSQAQLNAPYQQQLAQAAFPYQQAQFLAGITGSLAPGLGGTTYGTGQTTAPAPSALSQILGLGTAGAGILGGSGAFGSNGWLTGSNGIFSPSQPNVGATYGGYSPTGASLGTGSYGGISYPAFRRGGAANPYHFDEGGDVPDTPIDVRHETYIPQGQIPKVQEHRPNLNLNPPAPQQQSGSGIGSIIGDVAKIGALFAKDGGSITSQQMKTFDGHNPYKFFRGYDDGGDVPDDVRQTGNAMLRDAMIGHGYTPAISDQTRTAGMDQLRDAMTEKYGINPNDPYRMPSPDAVAASDAELKSRDPDIAASLALPPEVAAGTSHPAANPYADQSLSAYSAPDRSLSSASPSPEASERHARDTGFIGSPWAALTAAGLGMMAGTSPFAAVNIGQGGLAGIKTLEQQREASQKDETIDQAAKRLEQESRFHEDQYTRMPVYQQEMLKMAQRKENLEELKPVKVGTDLMGQDIYARRDPKTGDYINVLTGKKVEDPRAQFPSSTFKSPSTDESAMPDNARFTQGINVPEGVNSEVLLQLPPTMAGLVRAVDEGRQSLTSVPPKQRAAVEYALHMYDPSWDQTVFDLRKKQNMDLSTNGNAGKMILAVNQLLPHLNTLSERAQALANTGLPAINSIKGAYLNMTGDPRVKEFNEVREVAAMDAARLLRGSGQMAEKDIEFWRENLASSGSPQQLQGQIKMLADDLMDARIKSIEQSYSMNMRMKAPQFVSPDALAAREAINKRIYVSPQQPVGQAPAAPAPAAGAPAVPAGKSPVVYQNGHEYHLQPDGTYK